MSVGALQRVVVDHSASGHGAGWFLNKLVVTDTDDKRREYEFPCLRWLDDHHDDKQTTRELVAIGGCSRCVLYHSYALDFCNVFCVPNVENIHNA